MKGGKKMVTIILAVAILAYAGWAIYEIRMKKKNGVFWFLPSKW